MITRLGKIARLPHHIRKQLNHRLLDGVVQLKLVQWLNSLPEVQAVLAAEFEGRPINEQNISDWKAGGYRDWVVQQETLEMIERMATETGELKIAAMEPLTDKLALWVAARYVVAARAIEGANEESSWKLLHEFCNDVVALRKGDHSAERLKLERERLDIERARVEREVDQVCTEWARRPEVRKKLFPDKVVSEAEVRSKVVRILDEHLLGIRPQPDATSPDTGTRSQGGENPQ